MAAARMQQKLGSIGSSGVISGSSRSGSIGIAAARCVAGAALAPSAHRRMDAAGPKKQQQQQRPTHMRPSSSGARRGAAVVVQARYGGYRASAPNVGERVLAAVRTSERWGSDEQTMVGGGPKCRNTPRFLPLAPPTHTKHHQRQQTTKQTHSTKNSSRS